MPNWQSCARTWSRNSWLICLIDSAKTELKKSSLIPSSITSTGTTLGKRNHRKQAQTRYYFPRFQPDLSQLTINFEKFEEEEPWHSEDNLKGKRGRKVLPFQSYPQYSQQHKCNSKGTPLKRMSSSRKAQSARPLKNLRTSGPPSSKPISIR